MLIDKKTTNRDFYLEVLPILIDKRSGQVCMPGTAFKLKDSKLILYTAVSYRNKAWYSDVDNEEPFTENELYLKNRIDAITGYGQGEISIDLYTLETKTRPIPLLTFLKYRNKSERTQLTSVTPVLLKKPKDHKDKNTNVYTIKQYNELLTHTNTPAIPIGISNLSKILPGFDIKKYRKKVRECQWVGLQGVASGSIVYLSDICSCPYFKIPLLSFPWNPKDPFQGLNEKVRAWLCFNW